MKINRKNFLRISGLGLAGLCTGGGFFSGGCSSAPLIQGSMIGNRLSIDKTHFAENDNVLVTHSSLKAPVLVHKFEESYSAVLMLCTHKACQTNLTGSFITCPCHGSEFTIKGKVLSPPANEDLVSYPVEEDNSKIYLII